MIDPFNNPTLETGEADSHSISTDHPYLKALGLSVFTTGNLYNWYNIKDEKGAYSNRKLIAGATIDTLLGTPHMNDAGWGEWEGWRKKGHTGYYRPQKWNNWSWTYDLLVSDYKVADLKYSIFQGVTNAGYAIDYATEDPASTDLALKFNTAYSPFPGSHADRDPFRIAWENPIITIIQMNRWMNTFKRMFPEELWKNSVENLSGRNLNAIDIFLKDIKASKFSHLAFSGLVPFNINLADGGVQCIKHDYVTYKLHLYDDFKPRIATNFAILKNPGVAGVKKDATGRVYGSYVDGEYVDADPSNPSHMVVGDIDRFWNPVTEKWESGTANLMGVVDTPGSQIDAAYNNPVVENLIHSDIGLDLDGDPENHFAPSSGYVMPIYQQNSNPLQWQPNYAQPSGCRVGPDKNEKAKVIGFNFNPLKEYPHGSLVMLSKIGSIWHITDMGSGVLKDADRTVDAGFDGKWEFQYLATNSINFFNAREDFTFWIPSLIPGFPPAGPFTLERDTFKVDPARTERAFHKMYYKGDTYNGMYYDGTKWNDGERFNEQFSTIGVNPIFSRDGWWQFSSFDFVDRTLCGTRATAFGNAISTTQATLDAAGRAIPLEEIARNPAHSGPFFGCVFPDGYRVDSQLTEYWSASRTFNIRKIVPRHTDLADLAASTFNTSWQRHNKNNPFWDQGLVLNPADGSFVSYNPPRNDVSAAVLNENPEADFAGGEDYYARTPWHGPSMFFMESERGSQDLKQLPADIGTNASPVGENGGPFRNIHAFDQFHKRGVSGVALHANAVDAFVACSWLAKVDDSKKINYGPLDSAFNFKPKRPSTIQFRPLKFETYSQFHKYNIKSHGLPTWQFPANSGRMRWSAEGRRQMLSKARQTSTRSMIRNVSSAGAGNAWGYSSIFDTDVGLKYNVDIPRYWNLAYGTQADEAGMFPSYQGRIHKRNFWNAPYQADLRGCNFCGPVFLLPWMNCPPEWTYTGTCGGSRYDGGNGYGVIGAVCTVTANKGITFNTEQNVGMGSESWSTAGGGGRWYQRPTWGGTSCSYNTNRTTELHATIYHQWPRMQTLFDARYYAVHHFNERPDLLGKAVPRSGIKFTDPDGTEVTYGINSRDFDQGLNNVTQLSVDNRVPCSFYLGTSAAGGWGPGYKEPVVLHNGTVVWSDAVGLSHPSAKIMPERFWDINFTRVGKLLPYKYNRATLGVPWVSGATIGVYSQEAKNIPDDTPAKSLANTFILVSAGSGYEVGDIVGSKDYGVMASVQVVDINYGNSIMELKVFDVGHDIPASQSFPSGTLMDKDTRGGIALGNVATNGNGFTGFFVNSMVHWTTAIDQKPLVVESIEGRIFRVSAPADNTPNKEGTGMAGSQFGFIKTSVEQTINIEEEWKSPNGKYDIFLHFHNDITHTWGNNHEEYRDFFNPFENDEQYIQTSISTV